MNLYRAAFAAAVVAFGLCLPVRAAAPLSLDAAFERVLSSHPEFAVARAQRAVLDAERDRAALKPVWRAELSVENALGTGAVSGFKGTEVTLSLASVIERGDKRAARVVLAERRIDASAVLREGRRLDLLAEVARRYLDVVVAEAEARLAVDEIAQRERTLVAARQRVDAGGAPASVRLAALAAKQRAEGRQARARQAVQASKRRLALMWGERADVEIGIAETEVAALPGVVDFADVRAQLASNPDLQVFAHEARVREARLRLAQSAQYRDPDWQIGLRRIEDLDDWALVGSLSVPLGASRRAAPDIAAAQAELDALSFERDAATLDLEATLAEAHAQFEAAAAEITRLDDVLLPTLHEAEQSAADAYRRGALSYLEWAQLQGDSADAQRERLAAAVIAHRALIEIQRLTGATGLRADARKGQHAMNTLQRILTSLALVALAACGDSRAPQGDTHGDGHDDEHGQGDAHAEAAVEKGPHGGRMLRQGEIAVELAIFEDGVPPEFHAWLYRGNQSLAATAGTLTVTLERLGGIVDTHAFTARNDRLVGQAEVYEPHSFDVIVEARIGSQRARWTYDSYEGRTSVAADIAASSGIVVAPAAPGVIRDEHEVQGLLTPIEGRHARVVARFPGPIRSVLVGVGDEVRQGQVLATIESNLSLSNYAVTAPLAGTVLAREAGVGELAGEASLFEIADLSRLWVDLHLFGADAQHITRGLPVEVTRLSDGVTATTQLDRVLPATATASQSTVARATLDNTDGRWRPGAAVKARVTVSETPVALAVPLSALQKFRDWDAVFIRVGDDYEVRPLALGRRDGRHIEVLSGLKPGDQVVVEQSYLVKADIEKSGASHDH